MPEVLQSTAESIRSLTRTMQAALDAKNYELFDRLAGERSRRLEPLGRNTPLSDDDRQLLRELANLDRTWIDLLQNQSGAIRAELDQLTGRRSALRTLSRAYENASLRVRHFSRRG